HTLRDLKEAGYAGFTKLYEEIRAGRLVATKIGRRTIILDEDLKAWLDALPRV
ncbi:DNA-binding protein, partial [Roseibium hamelinense]|nr:DNA-binding protein [Roseibium hamelinense]